MSEHIGYIVVAGHAPALRVITKDQLARALHARTSHIIIWHTKLARPFARLLWAQRLSALADLLTGSISREYGVKFGSEWKVARHIDGEIILIPGDPAAFVKVKKAPRLIAPYLHRTSI